MPARRCWTKPANAVHYHREHRSKRNRRNNIADNKRYREYQARKRRLFEEDLSKNND